MHFQELLEDPLTLIIIRLIIFSSPNFLFLLSMGKGSRGYLVGRQD